MGPFITFEGGEGSGKSTQARLLAEWLRSQRPVRLLREPGGTALGEAVYRGLQDPKSRVLRRLFRWWSGSDEWRSLDVRAELFLFAAARAQLVARVLRPALERGEIVICDRYADSTTAYQGYGRGLPLEEVAQINAIATKGLEPDLTLLLDLPPEEGLARSRGAAHRMEQEGLAFHHRVREGYLEIARQEPERFAVLDGREPVEVLAEMVRQEAKRLF